MGYRSDVLLKVDYDSSYAVTAYMLGQPKEWQKLMDMWGDRIEINSEAAFNYSFRLCIDGVKWYDSYDDIKAVERFWDFLDDYNDEKEEVIPEVSAVFIRIGEDTSDIEERSIGEGYELAYVGRYINEED